MADDPGWAPLKFVNYFSGHVRGIIELNEYAEISEDCIGPRWEGRLEVWSFPERKWKMIRRVIAKTLEHDVPCDDAIQAEMRKELEWAAKRTIDPAKARAWFPGEDIEDKSPDGVAEMLSQGEQKC